MARLITGYSEGNVEDALAGFGDTIELDLEVGKVISLGRRATIDTSYNPKTSGEHALIKRMSETEWALMDLNSTNGTYVSYADENENLIENERLEPGNVHNLRDSTNIRLADKNSEYIFLI